MRFYGGVMHFGKDAGRLNAAFRANGRSPLQTVLSVTLCSGLGELLQFLPGRVAL